MREISSSSTCEASKPAKYHIHATSTKSPKTDCWHCCHPFDGEMFRLPVGYNTATREFHVKGCFCSLSCASAHIKEAPTADRMYIQSIFKMMCNEIYKEPNVVEAPSRYVLQKFGGPVDIDKFRSNASRYNIVEPPFVSHIMIVEEKMNSVTSCERKGTVRGLRRPEDEVCMESDNLTMCSFENKYNTFLESKQATVSASPPVQKKSAAAEKPRASNSSLQRFIKDRKT